MYFSFVADVSSAGKFWARAFPPPGGLPWPCLPSTGLGYFPSVLKTIIVLSEGPCLGPCVLGAPPSPSFAWPLLREQITCGPRGCTHSETVPSLLNYTLGAQDLRMPSLNGLQSFSQGPTWKWTIQLVNTPTRVPRSGWAVPLCCWGEACICSLRVHAWAVDPQGTGWSWHWEAPGVYMIGRRIEHISLIVC